MEAKRREPWNYSEFALNSIKNSIRLRYNLLLYVYTKFFESTLTGIPICKPLWLRFASRKSSNVSYENYCNMIFGDDFIVIPYLNKEKGIELDFENYNYYNFFNGSLLNKNMIEELLEKDTKNKKITLLVVGGSVIPVTDKIE
jgi:alpha-glucosidase (family GH31 glycosyl hydrolase)